MNVLLWMWMCSMMYECLINVLFVWWPDFEDVLKMFGRCLDILEICPSVRQGFGLCFNASTTEWFPLHLETCSRWVHKKKCHGVFQPLENAGRNDEFFHRVPGGSQYLRGNFESMPASFRACCHEHAGSFTWGWGRWVEGALAWIFRFAMKQQRPEKDGW